MCGICHCTYGHRKLRYGCAKNQTALAKEFQFMFAKKLQKTLHQKYRYKHNAYSEILGGAFSQLLFLLLYPNDCKTLPAEWNRCLSICQWQALGVRRYLGAVFWRLMYRYGRGVAKARLPLTD